MNLSNKIGYENDPEGYQGDIAVSDVKNFIKEIEKESAILLGKDLMVIPYSKFKELAGEKLI